MFGKMKQYLYAKYIRGRTPERNYKENKEKIKI